MFLGVGFWLGMAPIVLGGCLGTDLVESHAHAEKSEFGHFYEFKISLPADVPEPSKEQIKLWAIQEVFGLDSEQTSLLDAKSNLVYFEPPTEKDIKEGRFTVRVEQNFYEDTMSRYYGDSPKEGSQNDQLLDKAVKKIWEQRYKNSKGKPVASMIEVRTQLEKDQINRKKLNSLLKKVGLSEKVAQGIHSLSERDELVTRSEQFDKLGAAQKQEFWGKYGGTFGSAREWSKRFEEHTNRQPAGGTSAPTSTTLVGTKTEHEGDALPSGNAKNDPTPGTVGNQKIEAVDFTEELVEANAKTGVGAKKQESTAAPTAQTLVKDKVPVPTSSSPQNPSPLVPGSVDAESPTQAHAEPPALSFKKETPFVGGAGLASAGKGKSLGEEIKKSGGEGAGTGDKKEATESAGTGQGLEGTGSGRGKTGTGKGATGSGKGALGTEDKKTEGSDKKSKADEEVTESQDPKSTSPETDESKKETNDAANKPLASKETDKKESPEGAQSPTIKIPLDLQAWLQGGKFSSSVHWTPQQEEQFKRIVKLMQELNPVQRETFLKATTPGEDLDVIEHTLKTFLVYESIIREQAQKEVPTTEEEAELGRKIEHVWKNEFDWDSYHKLSPSEKRAQAKELVGKASNEVSKFMWQHKSYVLHQAIEGLNLKTMVKEIMKASRKARDPSSSDFQRKVGWYQTCSAAAGAAGLVTFLAWLAIGAATSGPLGLTAALIVGAGAMSLGALLTCNILEKEAGLDQMTEAKSAQQVHQGFEVAVQANSNLRMTIAFMVLAECLHLVVKLPKMRMNFLKQQAKIKALRAQSDFVKWRAELVESLGKQLSMQWDGLLKEIKETHQARGRMLEKIHTPEEIVAYLQEGQAAQKGTSLGSATDMKELLKSPQGRTALEGSLDYLKDAHNKSVQLMENFVKKMRDDQASLISTLESAATGTEALRAVENIESQLGNKAVVKAYTDQAKRVFGQDVQPGYKQVQEAGISGSEATASGMGEGTTKPSGASKPVEMPPSKAAGPALEPEAKPPIAVAPSEPPAPSASEATAPALPALSPSPTLAKLQPYIVQMEAKLATLDKSVTLKKELIQTIKDVAALEDLGRIGGLEEWGKQMVNRTAEQIEDGIAELLAAKNVYTSVAQDPSNRIILSIGDFDFSLVQVQPNGSTMTLREFEVFNQTSKPLKTFKNFYRGIKHTTKKISNVASPQAGQTSVPKESIIRIEWPSEAVNLENGSNEKLYQRDGSYVIRDVTTKKVYETGNFLDKLIESFDPNKATLTGIEKLDSIRVIDESGHTLWLLEKVTDPSTGATSWTKTTRTATH